MMETDSWGTTIILTQRDIDAKPKKYLYNIQNQPPKLSATASEFVSSKAQFDEDSFDNRDDHTTYDDLVEGLGQLMYDQSDIQGVSLATRSRPLLPTQPIMATGMDRGGGHDIHHRIPNYSRDHMISKERPYDVSY